MRDSDVSILGAGMTGLAAGLVSGYPVYESAHSPGGICSSYYLRPGDKNRLWSNPNDSGAFRFETGGGHWIFGGDPVVLRFIREAVPTKKYHRRSSVYFSKSGQYVAYPLQNHLRELDPTLAVRALTEMIKPAAGAPGTMADWLEQYFGKTLVDTFFGPFHDRYTAGLWTHIAPQDSYKTPVNLSHVARGLVSDTPSVGYNVTFIYPIDGLDALAAHLATRSRVNYGKDVVRIDVENHELHFGDGSVTRYETLLSTLPLNRALQLAELSVDETPDPFTSVLVLNIGGRRGPACPPDHWLYIPDSNAGFHRVGFYSNVDASFVPHAVGEPETAISLYVERAYRGGTVPSAEEVATFAADVVTELKEWKFLDEADIVDPTWVDVAYTWSWPGSKWRQRGMELLESHDIFAVGRYGRWVFQGIADSLKDGFVAGGSFADGGPR